MQGHIHKRIRTDKSGKERTLWYVIVDLGVDHGGRRRQKWHGSFRTRREAEVARAKLVDELHSGTYVSPTRTTLSEWAIDSWLPMMATRIKPSTSTPTGGTSRSMFCQCSEESRYSRSHRCCSTRSTRTWHRRPQTAPS